MACRSFLNGGQAAVPDYLQARPRISMLLFRHPSVVYPRWNHIASARGSEEIGMETMKIHVLERALTAACIVAAIAVVWWGIKILSA